MVKTILRKTGYMALLVFSAFWSATVAQAGPEQGARELETALAKSLKLNLNLSDYSVQRIASSNISKAGSAAAADRRVDLMLDGRPVQLLLSPHSVRGADMKVYTVDEYGIRTEVPVPPANTYRGSLKGVKGSKVAASLNEEGQLKAWIQVSDEIWAVQPLAASNVAPDLHVVYRSDDVIPANRTCGADEDPFEHMPYGVSGDFKPAILGEIPIALIAFDSDFEYFLRNGSSVANVIADINAIMNAINLIYMNETGIVHAIGTIFVRTGADPYFTTSPNGILSEFRNEWITNQAEVPRDVAHMMTGKDLDGSTIAIAFQSAVCNFDIGYGVSQSQFISNFALRVALTAHQLGHNWSAGHCDGDIDCAIMCSSILGCTGVLNQFGTRSTNSIINWANSVMCL